MKRAATITAIALLAAAASMPAMTQAAETPAAEMTVHQGATVRVRAGGVDIDIAGDQAQHVAIYALTGQVVKQFDSAPGSVSVDLPSGYYIVRVGHTTVKVAVK